MSPIVGSKYFGVKLFWSYYNLTKHFQIYIGNTVKNYVYKYNMTIFVYYSFGRHDFKEFLFLILLWKTT